MVSRNLLRYDRAMPNTRTTLLAAALITAAIGVPLAGPTIAIASAQPVLQEDDPGWNCATSGDRICGPNGDDLGHAAGCYNDAAALVAPWPCHVVINADGSSDVYQ